MDQLKKIYPFIFSDKKKREIFIKEFERWLEYVEIISSSQMVRVTNMGLLKAGKSSLFNSLLGLSKEKERFKTLDGVRATTAVEEQVLNQSKTPIVLVDTPGLDAPGAIDDATAFEAYREAEILVYVHNINLGDIREKEIEFLKKREEMYPDIPFIVVFTRIDRLEEKELKKAADKCINQLKGNLKKTPKGIFMISNSYYQRGLEETDPYKKDIFIKKSGIDGLREWIINECQKIEKNRLEKVKELKGRIISMLTEEIKEIDTQLSFYNKNIDEDIKIIVSYIEDLVENFQNFARFIFFKYDYFRSVMWSNRYKMFLEREFDVDSLQSELKKEVKKFIKYHKSKQNILNIN